MFLYASSRPGRDIFLRVPIDNPFYFLPIKIKFGMTPVLISNHKTDFTDRIYKPAQQHRYFQVRRYISCNGAKRESAGEVLALFK